MTMPLTLAPGTLGPVRQTYAGASDFPPVAQAYQEVAKVVRERGLMGRARWFYAVVGVALAVGFAGAGAGFILLGDRWYQLLIAAALGILFTQVAFVAHEAAHRQVLNNGPTNDRLARLMVGVVGMSYSWWTSKHNRHHSNPNKVGKDPDIDVDTISFLDVDAAESRGLRRIITRRQGWLLFGLLTLEGLMLHFGRVLLLGC
ncbi:MAG: fatty acid desaturase, partial [Pseudoclavibacter sp.]